MKQPRAWQRMLSGRRLDLLDPTPMDIEVEDIAHGLAFVARWNGQTIGDYAYSVAEHSLLVTDIFLAQNPTAPIKMATCGTFARCARIRDWRYDQPRQGRSWPRLRRA